MPPPKPRQPAAELTPKQRRFAVEYAVDLNGTQAAIRAGYSPTGADVTGNRLLRNPKVRQEVERLTKQAIDAAGSRAERVVRELEWIGHMQPKRLLDPKTGALLSLRDMPEDVAAAISSVEIQVTGAETKQLDDGAVVTQPAAQLVKIKFWDKTKALDLLARKHGLLVEKVEHKVEARLEHLIALAHSMRTAKPGGAE